MTTEGPITAEAFRYLDRLRESGITNMFGARPYLERDQGLSSDDARTVLSSWMKTFSHEKTPDERALEAARTPTDGE